MEVEAPPAPVDPHDPLRAEPHRQHRLFIGDLGPAARRPDAGVLRLPRPRVRAQPDRGGHRRALPPELRPHRRPEGRPAQGLDRRDEGRHGALRGFCDEMEGLVYGNEIFQTRTRGHRRDPAPTSPCPTACPAPTCAARASTGTSAATPTSAWPTTRSTGRSGPTPTATASPGAGCASRRSARPAKIIDQLLDGLPSGPIMAKVPRIIKVPEGEAYVETENPLGAMGYYVVSKGRHRPVPGEDPLGELQQHLGRAVAAQGRLRARHHHDPREPLLHPRGHRPVMRRLPPRPTRVLAVESLLRCSAW